MLERWIADGVLGSVLIVVVVGLELVRGNAPTGDTKQRWLSNWSLYGIELASQLLLAPLVTAALDALAARATWAAAIPGWAELPAGLLALDLGAYWQHRLSHRIGLLWRIHAVHHSDRALDVTTTLRHHPAEIIPAALAVGLCGALLGVSAWTVALYATLALAVQLLAHADLGLPRGLMRMVGFVLVTPEMHGLHHSRLLRETDSNYGQLFSFWDRLFGSFGMRPKGAALPEPGLDTYASSRFHTVGGVLLAPVLRPDEPAAGYSAAFATGTSESWPPAKTR